MHARRDAIKWQQMYQTISSEFGYDKARDDSSARRLDATLDAAGVKAAHQKINDMIRGHMVLVVGAGPSLDDGALGILSEHAKNVTVIAADTAVNPMVRQGIIPDIIVSDLDGDIESHVAASERGAVVVVHAHGDNMNLLHHAKRFASCMGTTQTAPVGCLYNFGGFTDGDRAIFLASHFGADSIILFGMDLGSQIGMHSGTAKPDEPLKIRKMAAGKRLVEQWLVPHTGSRLFTTAGAICGFDNITYDDVIQMIQGHNEFNISRHQSAS